MSLSDKLKHRPPSVENRHLPNVPETLGALIVVSSFSRFSNCYHQAEAISGEISQVTYIQTRQLGFSLHAPYRDVEGNSRPWDDYLETADILAGALRRQRFNVQSRGEYEQTRIATVRGALARDLLIGAGKTLKHFGEDTRPLHIAITSCFDTPEVGIPTTDSAGGAAFLFVGKKSETGRPWQRIA